MLTNCTCRQCHHGALCQADMGAITCHANCCLLLFDQSLPVVYHFPPSVLSRSPFCVSFPLPLSPLMAYGGRHMVSFARRPLSGVRSAPLGPGLSKWSTDEHLAVQEHCLLIWRHCISLAAVTSPTCLWQPVDVHQSMRPVLDGQWRLSRRLLLLLLLSCST